VFQPIVALLLVHIFLKINISKPIILLSIGYIGLVIYSYVDYINSNKLCSSSNGDRVRWSWYNNWNKYKLNAIYLFLSLYILYLLISSQNKYLQIIVLCGLVYYVISKINYRKHVGEFWCYFANSGPLLALIIQYLI
jgi:hypothetical protein